MRPDGGSVQAGRSPVHVGLATQVDGLVEVAHADQVEQTSKEGLLVGLIFGRYHLRRRCRRRGRPSRAQGGVRIEGGRFLALSGESGVVVFGVRGVAASDVGGQRLWGRCAKPVFEDGEVGETVSGVELGGHERRGGEVS